MAKRYREWRDMQGGFAGLHREYRVVELPDEAPRPRRGRQVADDTPLSDWTPGEPEVEDA